MAIPEDDEASPFQPHPTPPAIQAISNMGKPPVPPGQSRFTPTPTPTPTPQPQQDQISRFLLMLTKIMHPGSQTAPAAPRFNQQGVEDEVVQK